MKLWLPAGGVFNVRVAAALTTGLGVSGFKWSEKVTVPVGDDPATELGAMAAVTVSGWP